MKKDEEKVEVIFDDPKEINGPYLSFYDNEKKRVRYIPTTEEMFHKVRNIRRDAIEKFKKQQKASEITEDDYKNVEKDIQKLTDDFTKEIDKIMSNKEKELKEI